MVFIVGASYKMKKARKRIVRDLLTTKVKSGPTIEEKKLKSTSGGLGRLNNLGIASRFKQVCDWSDFYAVIGNILERMWTPIPDRGVHYTIIAQVHQFRERLPRFVTANHLYGIFNQDTTFVDQSIERACRDGLIRQMGLVHGTTKVLIRKIDFFEALGTSEMAEKFKMVLEANSSATWFPASALAEVGLEKRRSELVENGFVSLDPSNPDVLYVRAPGQGQFLKLVSDCREWLLKCLSSNRWKELPESFIYERLELSKMYWKRFKGVDLEWILYEAVGGGFIEGFATPIGRGWKVLQLN